MKTSAIPQYLQLGEFYCSLSCGDEEIEVPGDCCKVTDLIENLEDLKHLLKSLRFWQVERIPKSLLEFAFSGKGSDALILETLALFEKDLSYLQAIGAVLCDSEKMIRACTFGNIEIVQFLHEHDNPFCAKAICEAATNGHVEILRYAHNNYVFISHRAALTCAVEHGHIKCVQYLLETGTKWHKSHYKIAIESGQLDCVIFAVKAGLLGMDLICALPNEVKHLKLLKALRDSNITFNVTTVEFACAQGYLQSLKFLHENGCPWNSTAPFCAAKHGHLPCLQYLHENGCPWAIRTCYAAAENGHLHCLQYAHEHGCPWNRVTAWAAAEFDHFECLEYLVRHRCPIDFTVISRAALYGNLATVKLLHEYGCEWDASCCAAAAKSGNTECLVYLHKNGCPWDTTTYENAISHVDVECLAYALRHDCPGFNFNTVFPCDEIQLTVLQFIHDRGIPFTVADPSTAAAHGYIQSLCFLYENGCVWNVDTVTQAVVNGRLQCLQFALLKGCPYCVGTCVDKVCEGMTLYSSEQQGCLQLMFDSGCKWDKWHTLGFC